MSRPYYTLVEIEIGHATPQFGDYTKSVVMDEMADMKQDAKDRGEKITLRIVKSGDTQAEINDAIAQLDY